MRVFFIEIWFFAKLFSWKCKNSNRFWVCNDSECSCVSRISEQITIFFYSHLIEELSKKISESLSYIELSMNISLYKRLTVLLKFIIFICIFSKIYMMIWLCANILVISILLYICVWLQGFIFLKKVWIVAPTYIWYIFLFPAPKFLNFFMLKTSGVFLIRYSLVYLKIGALLWQL